MWLGTYCTQLGSHYLIVSSRAAASTSDASEAFLYLSSLPHSVLVFFLFLYFTSRDLLTSTIAL
jgi:hypothetical protein